jgi:hypothetical protein
VLWAKAIKAVPVSGISSSATINAVATDAAGNVYVTGSFSGKVTLDNLTLTATKNSTSHSSDEMTVKISATGVFVWANLEGTNLDDFCAGAVETGHGIATDGSGNVYAVGHLVSKLVRNTGNCNFACNTTQSNTAVTCVHIVKYSATGAKISERKYSNSQATGSACGVISFADNIRFGGDALYISGQVAGSVTIGNTTLNTGGESIQNVFLLKMDLNLNPIWVRSVTGSKNSCYSVGDGLFVDNNEIYLSGIFYSGTVSFGACSASTTSSTNYLAKYNASTGTCSWVAKDRIHYGFVRHPDGNIVALIRADVACCNFLTELKEISAADGSTVDSTVAVMDPNNTGVRCFSALVPTPDGFVFSQNVTGSYVLGGTTISSVNGGDFMLIRYTYPAAPLGADAAAIKTKPISNLIVDPNPASHQINILTTDKTIIGTISIYDMSRRLMYKKFIGNSQVVIDVSKFSSGMYYVKAGDLSVKFMKQ